MNKSTETKAQSLARILLGSIMLLAGTSHMTFAREDFQAQVPDFLPLDKDFVVLASGVVEISFGVAMLATKQPRRRTVGTLLAAFFVAIFPGNISQYLTHTSAFGLDTDQKRFVRLFFQPVLVAAALWSTGALDKRRD
ncbi:MauE/DoxX family redox-associated membrane protein [Deinococcus sp.]|uniref:DoxX family protein n=1 Tax=Deinococcus sp. TaxID=47478 RepID=UPI0025C22A89|nr:MauE/DoxX family redox-associated membrane protein [Deinococcus sp.]